MILKNFKTELYFIKKAYKRKKVKKYLFNKYLIANNIYDNKIIEKDVNCDNFSIHVLTGSKAMTMFLWSMKSFYQVLTKVGQLYIHDDGTFNDSDIKIFNKYFPNAIIVRPKDIFKKQTGKMNKYPEIKKFRHDNDIIYLRKFIDPYFISDKEYRLIIDNDLIWFQNPLEIENVVEKNLKTSFMTKDKSNKPIHFKDGTTFGGGYNSGIDFYHQDSFSMDILKEYLYKVDLEHKEIRFIEQAGYAYCLQNLELLPYERYTIRGGYKEAVVKHYTGPRRELFYAEGIEVMKDKLL